MGGMSPPEEEKQYLLGLYEKTAQVLEEAMKGMKKWIFRYIRVFY
mgnify:CR=1 FL=1